MGRFTAWLVVIPLMFAGTETAHVLAYRLVYPQAGVRFQVLAETGHSYSGFAPLLLGVAGALILVGLAWGVVDGLRRQVPRPVPAWAFGLLPLACYSLQEFLERWIALGGFPWWMVEQPTFRVGLALQLPFGLLAFVLARFLLRAVERVVSVLHALATRPPALLPQTSWTPCAGGAPRLAVLSTGHAGRGPPMRVSLSLLCR